MRILLLLAGLLIIFGLWHSVFLMTGVLWWNAPTPTHRLPPLEPIVIARPDIQFVDLEGYLAAHPHWRPD